MEGLAKGVEMMDDLISRAAAIAQIKENYCHWCDHIDLCQSCETQDCIATIEQQVPAVDAVPMVHAHWVEEPDRVNHWHCSNCGLAVGMASLAYRYCYCCGAKMDGDANG